LGILDTDRVSDAQPAVAIARLVWAGPATVLASLGAVHIVRWLATRMPDVRRDAAPFGLVPVTIDTAVLCTLAVIVFALVAAFHDDAVRRFRWIALGALLTSFLPLIGVGNLATVLGIAAMHVAAYVPCVTLLPWLVEGTQ
jgi:hypothetical protein